MMIIVFGSINMDLVARTRHLPSAGETVPGNDFFSSPGGKGANQAVACARLNAPVCMIGKVGKDHFGSILVEQLRSNGVNTGMVTITDGPSGVALITVDENAENTIVVVPGANGKVGKQEVELLSKAISSANSLLLQLEIPLESVIAAARVANRHGMKVILDPAPASSLPDELYSLVDIITPNETECRAMVGEEIETDNDIEKAARIFLQRGVKQVIIKLGQRGVYVHDGITGCHIPAFQVPAIDTTAAGDAFNGGLAVALSNGWSLLGAARFASAVAALSTTRTGAQESMPSLVEVTHFLSDKEH